MQHVKGHLVGGDGFRGYADVCDLGLLNLLKRFCLRGLDLSVVEEKVQSTLNFRSGPGP